MDGCYGGRPHKTLRLAEIPGSTPGVTKTISLAEAQSTGYTPDPPGIIFIPKIHYCPYCAFTTTITLKLTEHLRIHALKKPFPCPHCPFQAVQVESIRAHIRTHTGEKPFACAHCPYRSTQKGNMKRHVLKHHASNF
ncbi:zinc finger protein 513-like [Homarus americanus]|nr:zinc finger protein 513-like [Homarus americanus]